MPATGCEGGALPFVRIQAGLIIAAIAGSFFVYCGQAATTNDGAVVHDAHADGTCCAATAPVFTKLAEADLAGNSVSAPVAVGAYRQIVVYITRGPAGITGGCSLAYEFRADASSPFGTTGQTSSWGGQIRVDGTDVRLHAPCSDSYHYVIAGVQ